MHLDIAFSLLPHASPCLHRFWSAARPHPQRETSKRFALIWTLVHEFVSSTTWRVCRQPLSLTSGTRGSTWLTRPQEFPLPFVKPLCQRCRHAQGIGESTTSSVCRVELCRLAIQGTSHLEGTSDANPPRWRNVSFVPTTLAVVVVSISDPRNLPSGVVQITCALACDRTSPLQCLCVQNVVEQGAPSLAVFAAPTEIGQKLESSVRSWSRKSWRWRRWWSAVFTSCETEDIVHL